MRGLQESNLHKLITDNHRPTARERAKERGRNYSAVLPLDDYPMDHPITIENSLLSGASGIRTHNRFIESDNHQPTARNEFAIRQAKER